MNAQTGGVRVTLSIVNTNNRDLLRKCLQTTCRSVWC